MRNISLAVWSFAKQEQTRFDLFLQASVRARANDEIPQFPLTTAQNSH